MWTLKYTAYQWGLLLQRTQYFHISWSPLNIFFFQNHLQSVKRFRSDSIATLCRSWSGQSLSAATKVADSKEILLGSFIVCAQCSCAHSIKAIENFFMSYKLFIVRLLIQWWLVRSQPRSILESPTFMEIDHVICSMLIDSRSALVNYALSTAKLSREKK